ncbi:MAG: 16S rRNA (cytosine(967)-C(5))-methyltransferase RsmB [Gemmatimonadaceae bacterium]
MNRTGAPRQGTGSVTEARVAAAEIFAALRQGSLLDPVFERRGARLESRDRRWLRELVYGTLRRRAWIDAVLDARATGGLSRLDAGMLDLLRLGTYQLLFMDSVPAYAAIAQTVELAKRGHGIGASQLANAVLRRIERERASLAVPLPADPVEALALATSHPAWLVQRWMERWGPEATRALLEANNSEAPLVLRPVGTGPAELARELDAAAVTTAPAPLVDDSLQVTSAVSLAELDAFRQGRFHLQDPASTLVTRYAYVPEGGTVADLCAAPGGKSVELARRAGVVLSSDVSWERLQRVRENVARLGTAAVLPFVADARFPALRDVDAVLIDVPCTGTGTFRRHPDARWRLKASDVAVLGALQRAILRAAAAIVRPGGVLVYSTCSLEQEENDEPVNAFLAAHPEFAIEPPPAGTVPAWTLDGGRLRVLPQVHGTDGAFAARLRRAA